MNLPLALRLLLWPLSKIYGAYVVSRRWLYTTGKLKQKRLKATVISVGNLTVGGTGKTPMVLWLAQKFLAEGKRVAILSRGYRGAHGTSDEINLLKHRLGDKVLFGVGPDRFANGSRLESENPIDVFLLDDGFQHLQLARDLDIVMLDGSRKLASEWLLPAGLLREPLSACRQADILIVSRKTEGTVAQTEIQIQPVFYSQTRLLGFRRFGEAFGGKYLSDIGPGPFVAFCGIGNLSAFFEDLARWHVPIAHSERFSDHHKYSTSDVSRLYSRAKATQAVGFVTTEKDAENLPQVKFELPVWIAVIDLAFTNESELRAAVDRKLATRGAAA